MTVRATSTLAVPCHTHRREAVRKSLRCVRALGLLLAAAAATVMLGADRAAAHADLVSIDPPFEAVLANPPSVLTMKFTETVALHPEGIVVTDDRGVLVKLPKPSVVRAVVTQPFDTSVRDGWYTLQWSVISEDGHVVRGSSIFGIGNADDAARRQIAHTPQTRSDGLTGGVPRSLANLFSLSASGAAAMLFMTKSRRTVRLVAIFSAAALASTTVWILSGVRDIGDLGVWWSKTPGWPATLRAFLLLALAVLPSSRFVAAIAPLGVVLSFGLTGHVRVQDWFIDGTLLFIHLVAAAAWLGAAPSILFDILDRRRDLTSRLALVQRFSRVALSAAPLAVLAGTSLALKFGALQADTEYLKPLLLKMFLVATAVAVGGVARRLMRKDVLTQRLLLATFAIDVVILIAVSVASAVLATTPPPSLSARPPQSTKHTDSAMCTTRVGNDMLHVMLNPGSVGKNTVTVSGSTKELPAALPLDLSISEDLKPGALEYSLKQTQPGFWSGSLVVPHAGQWSASVSARVDRFTSVSGTCEIYLEQR